MEYIKQPSSGTQQTILCCQCGTPTPPNPSNICINCIRSQVDISEGIQKQAILPFCKSCERYFHPPSSWIQCQLESRELLALCLKKLKGLNKSHLVDAGFIWTEPHSKRIKVKLTIQKEVLGSTILQQTFVVDYIVQSQMCDDCHRREAKDFWQAVVQIRQKVSHKKTFYYLEQLIMKHNIHSNSLNIKQVHDGLDFYYANKQHAKRMLDFLQTVVPCRFKTSERLISHDIQNNTFNSKSTFSVELAPICKNDIICLPKKVAKSLSNISQIVICTKITSSIHLVDPFTGKVVELLASAYWRDPFNAFTSTKQLSEFTVLDTEKDFETMNSKYCKADVYLMKNNDSSGSDGQFHCRTHLGHLLSAGDIVAGFDFSTSNTNDSNLDLMNGDNIPDVVLVKKVYGDRKKRSKKRNWKLKELPKETLEKEDNNDDYEEFLEDLEEDKEYRMGLNIYRDRSKVSQSESDLDDAPQISLEEMMDDLQIEDQPMESDGDEE
ncbi:60S ribosomal export protein NMD3 isoform X2 [Hydra vulgaris]|uniref:60S ribosomal export protein NMD3 n=1 Tax=Hydra vulgaris TaxID=6087 RepID=A0ABM4B7P8_HYDVU